MVFRLRVISRNRDVDCQLSQDVLLSFAAADCLCLRVEPRNHQGGIRCTGAYFCEFRRLSFGRSLGLRLRAAQNIPNQMIPNMDDLYKAARTEGQVVFGGAIKEENEQNSWRCSSAGFRASR